jgi:hypothetical protein
MAGPDASAPLSPLAAALLQGTAPHTIRLSAARGVLPLARPELLRVLVALLRDESDRVRVEAAASLSAVPAPELEATLADPSTDPDVLRHFALDPAGTPDRHALLIANPSTPGEALAAIVPRLEAAHLDPLLLNQTRLIAAPALLDAIESHPACTAPQRSRVQEFRLHFLAQPARTADAAPTAETAAAADAEAAPTPAAGVPPAGPGAGESGGEPGSDETAQPVDEIDNATRRILRMNTAEKIQLAFKGSREERSILIKDASKSVQEAVMQSPKLSENEVEMIAKMRSVTEDVLRIIAGHRDWSKNYSVVHALATNPRTPATIAMNMVTRLNSRDLKIVAGDRNVSEIVRRHARKTVESRNERSGGRH